MRLDSISTLGEVAPYIGTLDQAWKIMKTLCNRTNNIWNDWVIILGKIIARKKIEISHRNFYRLMTKNDEKLCSLLLLYEINSVYIETLEEYRIFNEKFSAGNFHELVKINCIQLPLRVYEDFDITYEDSCKVPNYTAEDRALDEEYNKTLKLIENANVDRIESFLYINEIKNRNIEMLDRVIWIIGEDMNPDRFSENIDEIKNKNISINTISLVFDSNEALDIRNQNFKHNDLFKNLPWKSIEVFVNSQIQSNIIALSYLNIKVYNLTVKFVHIKPNDSIWKYDQYFTEPHWFIDDYSILNLNKTLIYLVNSNQLWWSQEDWKSIKVNASMRSLNNSGVMIKIRKCNQMIIDKQMMNPLILIQLKKITKYLVLTSVNTKNLVFSLIENVWKSYMKNLKMNIYI